MSSIFKRIHPAETTHQKSITSDGGVRPHLRIKKIAQQLVANRQRVSIVTFLLLFAWLWLTYNDTQSFTAIQQTLALPTPSQPSNYGNKPITNAVSSPFNQEKIPVLQGTHATTPKSLITANQKAIELALAGQAPQATHLLEQALLNDPQAGQAFDNLRRLYAGFASQSYQLALEPSKPKAIIVELAGADRSISVQLDAPKASVETIKPTYPSVAPNNSPVAATTKNNTSEVVTEPTAIVATTNVEKTPSAAPIVKETTPVTTEPTPAQRKASQLAIQQAIKHWSEAWSKQDVKGYFASYAPSYSPKSTSRKAWMEHRQERILAPKHIKVELSEVKVVLVKPTLAKVSFFQSYSSDTLSARNQKTLELELINNAWLITSESGR